jgi:hypothetical protein
MATPTSPVTSPYRVTLSDYQRAGIQWVREHPLFPLFSLFQQADDYKPETTWTEVSLFGVLIGRYHDSAGGEDAALWYQVRTWLENVNEASWVHLAHWSHADNDEEELERLVRAIRAYFNPEKP